MSFHSFLKEEPGSAVNTEGGGKTQQMFEDDGRSVSPPISVFTPAPANHPALQSLDLSAPSLKELVDSCGSDFNSITLGMLKEGGDDHFLCILVTKQPPPNHDEARDEAAIKARLNEKYASSASANLAHEIQVRITCSVIERFAKADLGGQYSCVLGGTQPGKEATGTFGPLVKITKGSDTRLYRLSCHHAVSSERKPIENDRISILVPSYPEVLLRKRGAKNRIRYAKINQDSALVNEQTQLLHDLNRSIEQKEFRRWGSVWRSSGLTTRPHARHPYCEMSIDWALLEADKSSGYGKENKFPTGDFLGEKLLSDSWTEDEMPRVPPDTNTKTIQPDSIEVYKIGGVSGEQAGYINCIQSTVFLSDGLGGKQITAEWAIFTDKENGPGFVLPGDNGSLVFANNGGAIGIAIAGMKSWPFLAWMTQMGPLLDHIQTVTGADHVALA